MSFFPSSVPTALQLLDARNNKSVVLTSGINDVVTTIPVADTSNIPTAGYLTFEDGSNEVIQYTGTTATSLTGVTRGADSTTASAHSNGGTIGMWGNARYHNIMKEEIIGIAQNLSDRIGLSTNQILAPLGTNSLPSHSFQGRATTGFFSSAVDRIDVTLGGNAVSYWTPSVFAMSRNLATQGVAIGLANLANTSNAEGATIAVSVGGASAGDPLMYFNNAVWNWAVGMDNSDGDKFKLAGNYEFVGSNEFLHVTTAGQFLFPNGSAASPSKAYITDPTTGTYRVGAGVLGFSVSGVKIAEMSSTTLRIEHDSAAISLYRTSNGRQGYMTILNTFGGVRYHSGVNGGSETANIAHQFTSDSPSGGFVHFEIYPNNENRFYGDNAKINLYRTANSRQADMRILNGFGGMRLHAGPNGGSETTVTAFDFTCDSPSASTSIFQLRADGVVAMGPNPTLGPAFSYTSNASGDLRFLLYKNNATGDPYVNFSTNSTNFSLGIDNSDSDILAIYSNSVLGAGTLVTAFTPNATAQMISANGSSSLPFYSWYLDQGTGFFRQASGRTGYSSNAFETLRFGPASASDATNHNVLQMIYGGNTCSTQFVGETTTGVSTTATRIGLCNDSLVIVVGTDGTNYFRDIVVSSYNASTVAISSGNVAGSPPARTYSNDGVLKLAMASGSGYRINTFVIDVSRR